MDADAVGFRVGVDTGGTFTDMIGVDEDTNEITVTKRPSTPRQRCPLRRRLLRRPR